MNREPRYRGNHVYVVAWPEHMIVKAGETSFQRWRNFMGRGAVLHELACFGKDWTASLDYEADLHDYLQSRAPYAFANREESQWLLGNLGGSCETYRIDDWDVLAEMPAAARRCLNIDYFGRPVAA